MLIIYAHPHHKGHNGYILEIVSDYLRQEGSDFEIIDLYQSGFDPVVKNNELGIRQPRSNDKEIRILQDKIAAYQKLIIIHPTWWSNVPAILKGFYDRVLSAGFAYRYINRYPVGLLKGKKALVITTTGGPVIYQWLFKGFRSLKISTRDTLQFCGLKTRSCLIGNCLKLDDPKKRRIKRKIIRQLRQFIIH